MQAAPETIQTPVDQNKSFWGFDTYQSQLDPLDKMQISSFGSTFYGISDVLGVDLSFDNSSLTSFHHKNLRAGISIRDHLPNPGNAPDEKKKDPTAHAWEVCLVEDEPGTKRYHHRRDSWESRRDEIGRLYLEERKTLGTVMGIMETRGFSATQVMLSRT